MGSRYKILGSPPGDDVMGTARAIPLLPQSRGNSYSRIDGHGDDIHPTQTDYSYNSSPGMRFRQADSDGIEVVQPGLELSPEGTSTRPVRAGYENPPGYTGGGYFNYDPNKPAYLQQSQQAHHALQSHSQHYFPPDNYDKKIAGLRPRAFWAVVILLALIIAAAIGAGVGAGLAAQNHNKGSSAQRSAPAISIGIKELTYLLQFVNAKFPRKIGN
jgi:hypothetical protein